MGGTDIRRMTFIQYLADSEEKVWSFWTLMRLCVYVLREHEHANKREWLFSFGSGRFE